MPSDGPNRIRKMARHWRRAANIKRRLDQLERDFQAAGSMEAELRINEAMARQQMYLQRLARRVGMDARHLIRGRRDA